VAIANSTAPMTPPNMPVTTHANNKASKLRAKRHHSVPTMKPE